jgi:hypothetical protein
MTLRRETILLLPLYVATMLAGGGCAAAGLAAAGPLLTALGTISSRSIERTLSADLETAWTATVETLSRMEIRVRHTDRSREAWVIKGTGGAVELHAELAPVTPRMTKVSLRVEAGGLQADKQTAEEVLNRVAHSLERPPAVAERELTRERDTLAEAVAALQGEVQHLRSAIHEQEERLGLRKSSPEPAGVAKDGLARGSGILVIPPSYGIPLLPGPTGPSMVRWGPSPGRNDHTRVPAHAPPETDSGEQEGLAAPLIPVETLAPVRSLDGRERGR